MENKNINQASYHLSYHELFYTVKTLLYGLEARASNTTDLRSLVNLISQPF